MDRFLKRIWFLGKLWALSCFLLVASQIRFGGETVYTRLGSYFQKPRVAKHFAQLLYPVHWLLQKTGVDVGWADMERTLAWVPTREEELRQTMSHLNQEQFEKFKEAAEAQKRALESIERELAE